MSNQIDGKFLASIARGDIVSKERLADLYRELLELRIEDIDVTLPTLQGIRNLLFSAAQKKQLTIISTGCPDYSTAGGHYSFESLGEDVSILPRLHLKMALKLLEVFNKYGVDFVYHILIADLAEGTDEVVVSKFCNGDMEEFLRRCECTRQKLSLLIKEQFPGYLAERMHAQTFSTFYGSPYNDVQKEYLDLILAKADSDDSFYQAFMSYHQGRVDLYRRFLAGFNNDPSRDQLKYRSARGIAQYLAHFNLVRLNFEAPIMINHRTISLQWVNRADLARNEEEKQRLEQKPRVPIFVIENKVY